MHEMQCIIFRGHKIYKIFKFYDHKIDQRKTMMTHQVMECDESGSLINLNSHDPAQYLSM